jgi:hypothetical protein
MKKSNIRIKEAYKKGYRAKEDGTIYNPKGKKVGFKLSGRNAFSYCLEDVVSPIRCNRFIAYQLWGDEIFKEGIVVRHLNDIKDDDRFENLALGTQADNIADKKRNRSVRRKYTNKERKTIHLYYLKYGFANTLRKFNFSGDNMLTLNIRRYKDYNLSLSDKVRMAFIRK